MIKGKVEMSSEGEVVCRGPRGDGVASVKSMRVKDIKTGRV